MTEFEDDDIEFIDESGPITCQVCSAPLQELSPEHRNAHYEAHFGHGSQDEHCDPVSNIINQERGSSVRSFTPDRSPSNASPKSRTPRSGKGVFPAKQNMFWTPQHASSPPRNFTPGLIQTLKRALLKTHAKGLTTRAILCHEGITHIAREQWDAGWGCGHRNFLMACTALLSQSVQPLYFPLLDHPTPPGVRNLQLWIEDAWANGFDREGAEQLKHKLVGTKKQIGTAELYTAFISRGIPAQLVDFPKSNRGPEAITGWVMNYFSPPDLTKGQTNAFHALKGASPIMSTELMPLILQHSGHSRTIVGVEIDKKGRTNLLVFDPSNQPYKALRNAALASDCAPLSPSKEANGSPLLPRYADHHHPDRDDKDHVVKRKWCVSNQALDGAAGRNSKRVRTGTPRRDEKGDDPTIIIDDSDGNSDGDVREGVEKLDPLKVVKFFRIDESKLGKKSQYQILWFPLDPPLQEDERLARRVVTSERVV